MRSLSGGRPDKMEVVVESRREDGRYRVRRDHWGPAILARVSPPTAVIPTPIRMQCWFEDGDKNRAILPWLESRPFPPLGPGATDPFVWPCFGSNMGRSWAGGSPAVSFEQWGHLVPFGSSEWVFVEAVAIGDFLCVREQNHPDERLAVYSVASMVSPTEEPEPGEDPEWATLEPLDTATLEKLPDSASFPTPSICAQGSLVFVVGATSGEPSETLNPFAYPWRLVAYRPDLTVAWDADDTTGGIGFPRVFPVDAGVATITFESEQVDFVWYPTPFLRVYTAASGTPATPIELAAPDLPDWFGTVFGQATWQDPPADYRAFDLYAPEPDGDVYDPSEGGGGDW